MTFANYESTFSKPRMDKNKTTNPFGQTTKRCLTAAGATFQNYESEFPDYEQRFSNYDWRSSTWNFQTTNGQKSCYETQIRVGKEQPRNYEARGRTVRCVFRELCSWSSVLWGETIQRKDHSETLNASSGGFCGVWAVTLWFCRFGGFSDQKGEEPSRSFEDLRGKPQTFGEPSRSFEFLRGPSGDSRKTFGEPSRSFEFLRGIARQTFEAPSRSFEFLQGREKGAKSFAPKMAKSEQKRPLQPEWSQFAQMMPRCAETRH